MTPRTLALVIAALSHPCTSRALMRNPSTSHPAASMSERDRSMSSRRRTILEWVTSLPPMGMSMDLQLAPRPRSSLRRRLMDLAKATMTPRFRPMEPGCRHGRLSRCPTTGTVVVSPDTATTAVTDPHRRLSHRTTSRHASGAGTPMNANCDAQLSFASFEFAGKKKRTKCDLFLEEMTAVVPSSVFSKVL